mgnify:CR=1 FL=1
MTRKRRVRIWHTDIVIGALEPKNAQEDFEQQLGRTVNRLRTMSLEKLGNGNRVSATRTVIQSIADQSRISLGLPELTVPELSDAALADQLAVVGSELLGVGNDEVLESTARQLQHLRSML